MVLYCYSLKPLYSFLLLSFFVFLFQVVGGNRQAACSASDLPTEVELSRDASSWDDTNGGRYGAYGGVQLSHIRTHARHARTLGKSIIQRTLEKKCDYIYNIYKFIKENNSPLGLPLSVSLYTLAGTMDEDMRNFPWCADLADGNPWFEITVGEASDNSP